MMKGEYTPMGNGFFDFMAELGIIGILVVMLFMSRAFFRMGGNSYLNAIIFLSIIVLLLQGEDFLNYPLFLALIFIYQTHVQPK